MAQNTNEAVFFALLIAGLWGDAIRVNGYRLEVKYLPVTIDYDEVLRLAEEQSVVGLVAVGFEKLTAYSLPFTEKLALLGKCQLIEQRNVSMNQFVEKWVTQMQEAGIDAVLVKGQGISQCYERPSLRVCGDVDLLMNKDNYEKAKHLLIPLSQSLEKESIYNKHIALNIDSWSVEFHGNMRCALSIGWMR